MAQSPKAIHLDVKANFSIVKPGDTLVVALKNPERYAQEQVREISEGLRTFLPDNVKVILIPESEMVVYRPDGTSRYPSRTTTPEEGDGAERLGHDGRTAHPSLSAAASDDEVYYQERARSDAPPRSANGPARPSRSKHHHRET